jgi:hypothetical protein
MSKSRPQANLELLCRPRRETKTRLSGASLEAEARTRTGDPLITSNGSCRFVSPPVTSGAWLRRISGLEVSPDDTRCQPHRRTLGGPRRVVEEG